jgi:NAD(P)-dependent dehydrogenase (short-subunit alcohol dehydrogenase family)
VLVTGAGSGIGEGIAVELAARGWRVAVNDVDRDLADRTAAAVGGVAVPGDVSSDAADLVGRAADALGGLAGLVNNAGIHRRAPLASVTGEDLDAVYAVNLRAVVLLASAAFPYLRETGGAIVNISSIAGRTPQMGVGLYTAAKAGVDAFTRQAAVEWGPYGVRVNAIAPGMVRTAMAEAVYSIPELFERRVSMVPLQRIGDPADIGRVTAFLLSDDAGYVTGQTITVDGGFTSVLVDLLPHPAEGSPG